MSKDIDGDAVPAPFKLDEYPGLERAMEAMSEASRRIGKGTSAQIVEACTKAAMDSLAANGWRFKPRKKLRRTIKGLEEVYWDDMDRLMELLMSDHETEVPQEELAAEARALAFCLAHLTDPFEPSVDAIRDEAVRRWEEANAE